MTSKQGSRAYLTNDRSTLSKYSAIKNGYYSDKILASFVEKSTNSDHVKSWRRTAVVDRGYAARFFAMDWLIERSLRFESTDCFLVLGAGYDTAGLRILTNQSFKTACKCWIEIDMLPVVERKVQFIRDSGLDPMQQLHPGFYRGSNFNYHIIECDLRDTTKLKSILDRLWSSVYKPKCLCIVNEVCLSYMKQNAFEKCLQTVIESVRNISWKINYVEFDKVKPDKNRGLSRIMLNHFDAVGNPVMYYPSRDEMKQLFLNVLGFNHLTIAPLYQMYHNAFIETRLENPAFTQAPFDEFEELDLYMAHYALKCGSMYLDKSHPMYKAESTDETSLSGRLQGLNLTDVLIMPTKLIPNNSIRRYGHSSCSLGQKMRNSTNSYRFMISGGFGQVFDTGLGICDSQKSKQKHQRINDCIVLEVDYECNKYTVSPINTNSLNDGSIRLDRMHGQLVEIDERAIFFSGGRQGPSRVQAANRPILAQLDDTSLTLTHTFSDDPCLMPWRHKTVMMKNQKGYQIGGRSFGNGSHPCVIEWNFSSDKLGYHVSDIDDDLLKRHSFGLDKRDPNVLLIMGGLLESPKNMVDRSVSCDACVIIWDTRTPKLIAVEDDKFGLCYGSSIHFIDENRLIKLGGISTTDGMDNTDIHIYDLRNRSWLATENSVDRHELPVILTNFTSETIEGNKILTIGGGGTYFTFGSHFNEFHLLSNYR